ncbi:MAG: hypothetical protein ACXVEE_12165 [Polyangiales bacterium]
MSAALRNSRMALLGAAILVSGLPLGCSTPTKMTSEWKDPSRIAQPMQKIVVIGLRLPPAQRHVVEDQLVASLNAKGTPAAPSYRVLGDTLPDSSTARTRLEQAGYEGALVVSLRGVTETPTYVPGSTSTVWGSPYWGRTTYDPGYVVNEKVVTFDSTLWDLRDGRRAWAATTETTNPDSGADSAKSLSKEIVPKLQELGVVRR